MKHRQRGEGTVFFDKRSNRWKAVAPWPHRLTRSGMTAAEAMRRRDEALMLKGRGPIVTTQTVREFTPAWLASKVKSVTPRTYEHYEAVLILHIFPIIGDMRVSNVTPQNVSQVIRTMEGKRRASATLRHALRIMVQLFDMALVWKLVSTNPARLVKSPRVRHRPVHPLMPDEVDTFVAGIRGDRDEAMVLVLLLLGLRRGEALGLDWSAIDLDAATITVRQSLQRICGELTIAGTKTEKSQRTLRLPRVLVEALTEWKARQAAEREAAGIRWYPYDDMELVFTTKHGTPREPRNVYRRIRELMVETGIAPRRIHDLRHTAATMLLRRKVPIKAVQALLGHSSAMTTLDIYSHLVPDMLDEAADEMDVIAAGKNVR